MEEMLLELYSTNEMELTLVKSQFSRQVCSICQFSMIESSSKTLHSFHIMLLLLLFMDQSLFLKGLYQQLKYLWNQRF